jgi:hypothetical protein
MVPGQPNDIVYDGEGIISESSVLSEEEKCQFWEEVDKAVARDLHWCDMKCGYRVHVQTHEKQERMMPSMSAAVVVSGIRAVTRSKVLVERDNDVCAHLGTGDNSENGQPQVMTEAEHKNNEPTTILDGHPQTDIKDTKHLIQLQETDDTWSNVIQHVKSYGQYWDKIDDVQQIDKDILKNMTPLDKKLYPIYKKAFVFDTEGILRKRKIIRRNHKKEQVLAICIPNCTKKAILRFHHGSPLSGHLGIAKLKPIINQRYHWPQMDKDLRRWVRGCAACQRRKQYRRSNYGTFRSTISNFPWERAAMDLVGPLPESDDHNRYILTIIDTFSRWPIAIPLPNKKSSVIAEAIYKNLISIHGCPKELFSDKEHTLLADSITLMCKNLGIKRITSSAYAPWQNGHVERFHRFLGASLSIYTSENKRDWDKWIDCVLFTYRVSAHAQTGESPYRLIYNRDPILGADLMMHNYPINEHKKDKDMDTITNELYKWFREITEKQKTMTDRAMANNNRKNKRVNPKFEKDDWILLYEPPVTHTTAKRQWRVPKKFQDTLTGPHRVTEGTVNRKGELTISHARRGKEEKVHISRLVLYNPWSDDVLDTAKGSLIPGHDIRHNDTGEHNREEIATVEFNDGDKIELNEMIAIYLSDEQGFPIIFAKITSLGDYRNDGYRPCDGTVYGNYSNNPRGVYRTGWFDPKDKKHYFAMSRKHSKHREFKLSDINTDEGFSTFNNILSGFQFTDSERLNVATLSRIATLLRKYGDNPDKYDLL